MKRSFTALVAALLVLGALAPGAGAEPAQPEPGAMPGGMPACVKLTGEAQMGAYGYNHVVRVQNGCTQDADCLVATSVDPTPAALKVAAQTSAELIVRVGSPARVFTPTGTCRLVTR